MKFPTVSLAAKLSLPLCQLTSWLFALLALSLIPAARAQCEPVWQPFDPSTGSYPGVNGVVYASTMWDPDGAGPQTPKLVVGGTFSIAGNATADNIAMYDRVTKQWSALGSGLNGTLYFTSVRALAVLPNGDLVVGGQFTSAGGVSVNNIARWDGSAWMPMGLGVIGSVWCLAVLPNGDLVVGGQFETAGGEPARSIARWNSEDDWSAFGSMDLPGLLIEIYAVALLPNGDLVAAGAVPGIDRCYLGRWNGSAWLPVGSVLAGSNDPEVRALAVLPNGDLVAAGRFTTAGGLSVNHIARWNDEEWSTMDGGVRGGTYIAVHALTMLPNGDLLVGGAFDAAGRVSASRIALWNGEDWSPLGSGINDVVYAITAPTDREIVASGSFSTAGGFPAWCIARWNGSSWSPYGGAMNARVNAITSLPAGDLVVGGEFSSAGGIRASSIARWDGSSWSPLGSGMGGGSVYALGALPGGGVIAGGDFSRAGPVGANNIARWDGSEWLPLGSGMNGEVRALAVHSNGDLFAGGMFTHAENQISNNIARWNGSAWSPLASGVTGGAFPSVDALLVLPNGEVVAGGEFSRAGSALTLRLARWDGTRWWNMPGLNASVYDIARLPDGDLMVLGAFNAAGSIQASRIVRMRGTSLSPLGAGLFGGGHFAFAQALLPNGDLVVGGGFLTAGGEPANNIARWNGSAWSPLGTGTNGFVRALHVLPNGDLVAGGEFTTAGGVFAPYLARWGPPRVTIADQPDAAIFHGGQSLTLVATASAGLAGVNVQWQRNGVNITDGPGGASPDGGTVLGASANLPSPTDGTPAVLIIDSVRRSDAGQYTVVFSNPCGSVTSNPATVAIRPGCPADIDKSGSTDLADFFAFLNCYDAGDPCADIDETPGTDLADFFLFFASFDVGC